MGIPVLFKISDKYSYWHIPIPLSYLPSVELTWFGFTLFIYTIGIISFPNILKKFGLYNRGTLNREMIDYSKIDRTKLDYEKGPIPTFEEIYELSKKAFQKFLEKKKKFQFVLP